MSKYNAEAAGHLVKEWTLIKERLRRRLRGLESAIDLDAGVRQLDPRLKKRIAKLVREGYEPETVNHRYPDPSALLLVVGVLKAEGKMREAAYVSRTIRDIRLLRTLAAKMSGRRDRKEILTRANRQNEGVCWSCHVWIERGEEIWLDRDHGVVWHRECPPKVTGDTEGGSA